MARFGDSMGFNVPGPSTALYDLSDQAGTVWLRYGQEWPYLLNTAADHTSGWSTAAITSYQNNLAALHARGKRAIVVALSVPTSINSASNQTNQWKYWPTNSTGDTAFAAYCVKLAQYLDPTKDILQVGNEINNISNFNLGNQTAARIGATIKAAIDAVRAAYPTLTIYGPSLCPVGNTGDAYSMAVWGQGLITGTPTLLTTSKPDAWCVHPYIWDGDVGNGGGIYGDNSPTGSQGWNGHIQADAYRQVLLNAGWTSPGLVITEHGEPSTPQPNWSEAWQRDHAIADYQAISFRRAAGWYVGAEIRHTLRDSSLAIDAGHEFGTFRSDNTAKPLLAVIQARAAQTSGSGGVNTAVSGFDDLRSFDDSIPFDGLTSGGGGGGTSGGGAGDGGGGTVSPPTDVTVIFELGVPPTTNSNSTSFVLDSSLRGRLDGTYTLAADFDFLNITPDVVGATVDRGRNRQLSSTEPGTMTVKVRDDRADHGTARAYDPFNTASPFYPNLRPYARLRCTLDGVRLFTGDVVNIVRDHETSRTCSVTFSAADSLNRLNDEVTVKPNSAQTAGARINYILRNAGYTRPTTIAAGVSTFQDGTEQTGAALDLVNDVALADQGLIWCTPDDVFNFVDRTFLTAAAGTPAFIFEDGSANTGVRYSHIDEDVTAELLYNRIVISGVETDSEPATAADLTSINAYRPRTLKLTLPLDTFTARQQLANQLLADFGTPKSRFRSVTMPTIRYSEAKRQQIMALDIGTTVIAQRDPVGAGTPSVVQQVCVITGVSHELRPRFIESTFTLEPSPGAQIVTGGGGFFTLNTSTLNGVDELAF